MKKVILAAAITIATASVASAATSSGSLTVTGAIESSISFTIESAGNSTAGTGTAAATSVLDNLSKYGGTVPSDFTRTLGASDWTLASTISVKVVLANLTSPSYSLGATLGAAPATGVTWMLGTETLNDSTASPLTATGAYDATEPYDWKIIVTDAAAPGSIANAINFTVSSN